MTDSFAPIGPANRAVFSLGLSRRSAVSSEELRQIASNGESRLENVTHPLPRLGAHVHGKLIDRR